MYKLSSHSSSSLMTGEKSSARFVYTLICWLLSIANGRSVLIATAWKTFSVKSVINTESFHPLANLDHCTMVCFGGLNWVPHFAQWAVKSTRCGVIYNYYVQLVSHHSFSLQRSRSTQERLELIPIVSRSYCGWPGKGSLPLCLPSGSLGK